MNIQDKAKTLRQWNDLAKDYGYKSAVGWETIPCDEKLVRVKDVQPLEARLTAIREHMLQFPCLYWRKSDGKGNLIVTDEKLVKKWIMDQIEHWLGELRQLAGGSAKFKKKGQNPDHPEECSRLLSSGKCMDKVTDSYYEDIEESLECPFLSRESVQREEEGGNP